MMTQRNPSYSIRVVLGLLAGLTLFGCATPNPVLLDLESENSAAEETAPLGGDALAERKREMQRAYRDMIHFDITLDDLRHRRDRNGAILFDQFLATYMGTRLEPMLRPEWQSRHPELMALDASLRFVQADILVRMHDTRRVQQVIEQIEARFQGRENTVVQYPIGAQGTISEGLEILRNRKWRG
jgi:hypothetical protein